MTHSMYMFCIVFVFGCMPVEILSVENNFKKKSITTKYPLFKTLTALIMQPTLCVLQKRSFDSCTSIHDSSIFKPRYC